MQEEIVKKIKESTLVVGIAGPGTGKTYTFEQIIASEEYKNKRILILSFINKLVDDLDKTFQNYSNVDVMTLHAFAKKHLPGNIKLVENLDEIITDDYLLMTGKEFNYQKFFCHNQLSPQLNSEEFKFYCKRKNFYAWKGEKLYSFNSSILVVNMFFEENEDQIPQYDLILIDEFQDFNKLECNLIRLLNKKNKIIVVGDDDQSLYEFKFAVPEIIRKLYTTSNDNNFSLDYCRRCTKVIVNASNNLIRASQNKGLLSNRIVKKFLYPEGENREKDVYSNTFNKIDFLSGVKGDLLIYQLSQRILQDHEELLKIRESIQNTDKKVRVLIIAKKHYHQMLYNGLVKKGFNVVEYELFSNERKKVGRNNRELIQIFNILSKKKTHNISLRQILYLYFLKEQITEILKKEKKIWDCISDDKKKEIERDIEIFKKAKRGKELNTAEIGKLNEVFNLKGLVSKMLNGFNKTPSGAIEVEIVNTMGSKGLSANLVYYLYVDDEEILERDFVFTDNKVCNILVAVTRAKEKLTLITKNKDRPQIIELLGEENINYS